MISLNELFIDILPDNLVPSYFYDIDGYNKTTKIPAIFVPLDFIHERDINGQTIQDRIRDFLQENAIHACIIESDKGMYITMLGLPSLIK